MEQTADIALIGLAVMGQNLILNMADHGYQVVAHNRTVSKVDEFLNEAARGHANVIGARSVEEVVGLLKRPRKIMLMVKAGPPVDDFIESLLPHLGSGDLLIDGGNSHFPDTIRRTKYLESKGLLLVDMKFEFGRHHGQILLGDEICPDTCRFWDLATRKKLDKDRFRQDLGGVEEAYHEVHRRVCAAA